MAGGWRGWSENSITRVLKVTRREPLVSSQVLRPRQRAARNGETYPQFDPESEPIEELPESKEELELLPLSKEEVLLNEESKDE